MSQCTRAGAVVVVGLLALTACNGSTAQGGSGEAVRGGTLHVLASTDLEHLDPARNYVTSSQNVARLIYRTLTTVAPKPGQAGGEIVPDLATDTGRPSDGAKTWTFTLKDGVKFEDGQPITSQDVKYGVERSFAPDLPEGAPYARMWLEGGENYKGPYENPGGLASIQTPDDKTIVFKLNRAVADFGSAASLPLFAPVPREQDTGVGYDGRPVSSGPYKIDKFEPKKRLELVRNEHWDQRTDAVREGLPDRVVLELNLDPAVVDQRLVAGQGEDASALAMEPIGAATVGRVANDPALKNRLVSGESINTRFLTLNTRRAPLDNVKVRQAIAYALDKDALRTVRGGPIAGDLATTLLPPVLAGSVADDQFPSPDGKGDVEKAKALLAEVGLAQGFAVTLDAASTPGGKAQGEAVQAALGRIGITVTINAISPSAFYSTIANTAQIHDMAIDGWTPDWAGPSTYLPLIFDSRLITSEGNNNHSQYHSDAVNRRLDEIAALPDPAAAATAYGELSRQIAKDVPVVPFLWDKAAILVGPKVAGAYGHIAYVGRVDLATVGLRK